MPCTKPFKTKYQVKSKSSHLRIYVSGNCENLFLLQKPRRYLTLLLKNYSIFIKMLVIIPPGSISSAASWTSSLVCWCKHNSVCREQCTTVINWGPFLKCCTLLMRERERSPEDHSWHEPLCVINLELKDYTALHAVYCGFIHLSRLWCLFPNGR